MSARKKKIPKPRITKREAKAVADAEFWSKKAQEYQMRADALQLLVRAHTKFERVLVAQRDSAKNASPATVAMLHEQLVEAGKEVERRQRECFPEAYEKSDAGGVAGWN